MFLLVRLGAVLELLLIVYCLLDVARTPASRVRTLPKLVWFVFCVIPPILGPIGWLVFGRPKTPPPPPPGSSGVPPEYDRPGRARASNPDDDAEFLEQVRRRAEEQRRKGQEPPPTP